MSINGIAWVATRIWLAEIRSARTRVVIYIDRVVHVNNSTTTGEGLDLKKFTPDYVFIRYDDDFYQPAIYFLVRSVQNRW